MLTRLFNRTEKDGVNTALSATGDTAAFLGVSVIVGVLVGVAAAVLIWASEGVTEAFHWLNRTAGGGRYFILFSVPFGLWAAFTLSKRFAPDTIGDGVPEATAALALHSGYLPTRSLFFKIIATALSIGGGG
ncbi:MAG: chloride channel protein, partial [Acidimicrobiia bacterium]|nr:chloride channel protein [Acidimicrobiia bacterium]